MMFISRGWLRRIVIYREYDLLSFVRREEKPTRRKEPGHDRGQWCRDSRTMPRRRSYIVDIKDNSETHAEAAG
jgi:hypothetical protein